MKIYSIAQKKDSIVVCNTLEKYWKYKTNHYPDSLIGATYDKVFTLVSKQKMKQTFQAFINNDELKVSYTNFKVNTVSNTFLYNTVRYVLVKFSYTMQMKFLMKGALNQNNNLALQYTLPQIQQQYGKDNVILDDANQTIVVATNELIYAINEDNKAWKFLESNNQQKNVLKYLIPKAVISKLK